MTDKVRCVECKKYVPVDGFYPHNKSVCKACLILRSSKRMMEKKEENRNNRREYEKEYREKNRERLRKYNTEYVKKRREEEKAKSNK